MKLKNICLGIACIAVVSACNDKMDYHEYTSYDKDYVFSDFSRTAGFVNNIYSYLDSDLPSCETKTTDPTGRRIKKKSDLRETGKKFSETSTPSPLESA